MVVGRGLIWDCDSFLVSSLCETRTELAGQLAYPFRGVVLLGNTHSISHSRLLRSSVTPPPARPTTQPKKVETQARSRYRQKRFASSSCALLGFLLAKSNSKQSDGSDQLVRGVSCWCAVGNVGELWGPLKGNHQLDGV